MNFLKMMILQTLQIHFYSFHSAKIVNAFQYIILKTILFLQNVLNVRKNTV